MAVSERTKKGEQNKKEKKIGHIKQLKELYFSFRSMMLNGHKILWQKGFLIRCADDKIKKK